MMGRKNFRGLWLIDKRDKLDKFPEQWNDNFKKVSEDLGVLEHKVQELQKEIYSLKRKSQEGDGV